MYAPQALLLVLAAASGYAPNPCVPDCRYPLPRNVENISYELHVQPYFPADGVEVDPAKKFTFDGFVRIHFRVNSFAQNVSLDHLNLTIQNVLLYRNEAAIDVEPAIDKKTGRLIVLAREHFVPTFNYTIEVSYTGLVSDADEGVAYSTYTNAKSGSSFMIHTQFEPRNARRLFPCFDDLHFKATFELTLTYPKGYTALSNTRPRTTLDTSEAFVSTNFDRTPRMSTYLLAFAIGKLVSVADFASGKEVRVWGWEEMAGSLQFAANISGKCVSAMQNYTGIPYALDKLDIVAVTGTGFAMENWGLIIAAFGAVYSDPKTTPVGRQWTIANVLCHEIAHQWFGDLVTADVWGDVFLHESFAEFFSNYLFMEFGAPGQKELASGAMAQEIERGLVDAESALHPLVYTTDDFDYVYQAGASILSTVEYVFGKDAFRDALRSYLRAHEFGNARYRDLVAAFKEQYAQVDLGQCKPDVNLTAFLDSWFLQPDAPLVDVVQGNYQIFQKPLSDRSRLPPGYEYRWTMLLDVEGPMWVLLHPDYYAMMRRSDDLMLYRMIQDELYFVGHNQSLDPTRAARIAIERLNSTGRDGRIDSILFGTVMSVLDQHPLENQTQALLTPIYSAIGWDRLDEDNWDKRALQESLLQWAVSYDVDDARNKAEGFALEFVAECGESKSFSDCITLNVDILPAALCAGLKSKNDSVIKLVDAYEAFLTQDYVQKYVGNAAIVDAARRCAQRNEE